MASGLSKPPLSIAASSRSTTASRAGNRSCTTPQTRLLNVLVIVSVHVAGPGHLAPWDIWMSREDLLRQPSRGLRDDFQAAGYRIENQVVVPELLVDKTFCEAARFEDAILDVQQPVGR